MAEAERERNMARESRQDAEHRSFMNQQEMAKLSEELAAAHATALQCDANFAAEGAGWEAIQRRLDDATALNEQLRRQLGRLGTNVERLMKDKGNATRALEDARARLEELRKAQLAAEARAALFRQLALKLRRMVDSGELQISLRDGRMVLQLPNDVLFDSGKTELRPAGRAAITQVAGVLRTIEGRRFQVAGHTDNVPIQMARFASNWELSTARAVEVVKLLLVQGVRAASLSAAGYGEFDPVGPNDTAPGKARNRRTEITLVPRVEEMVAVPEGGSVGG